MKTTTFLLIMVSLLFVGIVLGCTTQKQTSNFLSYDELSIYCGDVHEKTGNCPDDKCMMDCVGGDESVGCIVGCTAKQCGNYDSENCNLNYCQVLTNCKGENVCYYGFSTNPPECGNITYYGQDVECCAGLIKKCGTVLDNDSCVQYTTRVDDFPQCLPCGNGLCDEPFENWCNCPEDCEQSNLV